jgi:hypothetical protein
MGDANNTDQAMRLSDFLTTGELTIDNVMVAWAIGDPGGIEAGPWPDYSRWSQRYRMTDGACILSYRECAAEEKLWWLLTIFYGAVLDGVDPKHAHREFSKIKEWPQAHRSPPPTDPATLEAERAARHKRDMALFGGVDPRPRPAPRPATNPPAPGKSGFVLRSFKDVGTDDLEADEFDEDLQKEIAAYAAWLSSPIAITVTKSRTAVPGKSGFVLHAASDVTVDRKAKRK